MAFTCGFFNSVGHDRKYDAVQHGQIFDGIITDGIYATYLKAMVVKASENANEVIVQPGRAWFNHTWSYNDADYPVAAPDPEVVLDRIDTLVLDVNNEDAVRNNQFLWVQGTPTSQTPEPPTLIHTATHNQYPLCDVYRQAGTTQIYAADITNRVGTSDCPFVTGVLESIDIDDLLAQWDDEFHTWENATKASFEGWMLNQQQVYTAWFNALKTQMAGDVEDVEAWIQTIKDIIDEETATHLQLEIDEINSMLPSGSHITVTTSDTELYSRTVTITDEDNNTVTSQFDANGVAVFKSVPYVGNLTITSTDGVRTATEVVNTPYFARYEFTLAFWSATVNIIGDSTLGGDTVTITDSTTALVGTVVLNASGTGVFNATYPDTYKFSVTHGGETMEVSLAVTQETTYSVEIHGGFNYKAWLTAGEVSTSGYNSLADVFADEPTVRKLMLKHSSADYLINAVSQKLSTIDDFVANDTAMKWIGLCDYVCDGLTAISGVETKFLASAYWERYLKDHVPVMTSNTAPYGTASAYQVFDGNTSTTASGTDFSYKFVNPICPKSFYCNVSGGTLQASNDGSTWSVPTSGSYYLYLRLHFASSVSPHTIQFYGRELKVSVPVMTSNTAPYGTVSYSSDIIGNPYNAFNPSATDESTGIWYSSTPAVGQWLAYDFGKDVCIRAISLQNRNYLSVADSHIIKTFKIQGYNGTTWEDETETITNTNLTMGGVSFYVFDNNKAFSNNRLYVESGNDTGDGYACIDNLQFYGLDYSEKEFEAGTTKKWLYDHGVELVPMTAKVLGGYGNSDKYDSQIRVEAISGKTNSGGIARNTDAIDLTPYNLARIIVGDYLYNGNNASAGNTALAVLNASNIDNPNQTNISVVGLGTYNTGVKEASMDISSINQSLYLEVYATHGSYSPGKIASFNELWLE